LVDKKITELEEITTTSGSSIIYVIDYSSGSPVSNKITIEHVLANSIGNKLYLYSTFI
jgi:hypothetical protein